MEKQEVVAIMTGAILDENVRMAKIANVPEEQINSMMDSFIPQYNTFNGLIYDVLKEKGIIQ